MSLIQAIKTGSRVLEPQVKFADPTRVLCAIAEVESRFGKWNVPRFERAYAYRGPYFNHDQEERYAKWGAWACCSYGSFQIMYPVACELGFDRSPWNRSPADLWDDEIGIIFVCEYLKKRVLDLGATALEEIFDAYNSGSFRDHHVPGEYIQKALTAYLRGRPELELIQTQEA